MIRNFAAEKAELVNRLTDISNELTSIGREIQAADTVDKKLEIFSRRDRVMEQQRQQQVALIMLSQEEIEHMNRINEEPRFQPQHRHHR